VPKRDLSVLRGMGIMQMRWKT